MKEQFETAQHRYDKAREERRNKYRNSRAAVVPPREPIIVKTAVTLRCKEFEPIKYVVPGYIVEGCTILAGRPKIGKSWLLLEIGLAVARGGQCLGNITAQQGDVLYLALEDNERRLQNRITTLIGYAREWPEHFHYATEWRRANAGGLEQIRRWIAAAANPRLIVVDILALFRSPRRKDQEHYECDYEAIRGLQAIASETGVAIVIVHHLRKGAAEVDAFEKVSGTLGLSGAADTVLILDRDSGGATLYGRGRDLEEVETAVQFSRETCRWTVLGKADEIRKRYERTAILDALKKAKSLSPREVADLTGKSYDAIRQMLVRLAADGEVVKVGRGQYAHCDIVTPGPGDVTTGVTTESAENSARGVTPPTPRHKSHNVTSSQYGSGGNGLDCDTRCDTAEARKSQESQAPSERNRCDIVTAPELPDGSKILGFAIGQRCLHCDKGKNVYRIKLPGEQGATARHKECAVNHWRKMHPTGPPS